MSALKRKNIAVYEPNVQGQTGANQLPNLMKNITSNGEVYELPLDILTASPKEWNFYHSLNQDKMIELIESIQRSGLLHPIVVWVQTNSTTMNKTYQILSGHNRVEAFRQLQNQTKESKYQKISCVIKQDITPAQAREIIIDSNWISRTLSVAEKTKSIYHKYVLLTKDNVLRNGKSSYEVIAEGYGLSGRQVHRYLQLEKLINPLLIEIDKGNLSLRSGVILSYFSITIQQQLVIKYANQLSNHKIATFKKGMCFYELCGLMESNEKKIILSFEVPEQRSSEIKEKIQNLLKKELE